MCRVVWGKEKYADTLVTANLQVSNKKFYTRKEHLNGKKKKKKKKKEREKKKKKKNSADWDSNLRLLCKKSNVIPLLRTST
jgi:hypothetical protein